MVLNAFSSFINNHHTAESVDLKNVEAVSCPGINCIRGFIHLNCLRFHDQPISGSYNWTLVHPGLKDDYKLGENNPNLELPILDKKSCNFAEQAFATCNEAKISIYEQFMKALDEASQKISLNEQNKTIDCFSLPAEISREYANAGLTIVAIALSGWGIWKCYGRLYPLQNEHATAHTIKGNHKGNHSLLVTKPPDNLAGDKKSGFGALGPAFNNARLP